MLKRITGLLLTLCMVSLSTAFADWTAPDANLATYQEVYGQASESYNRIRYGAESSNIGTIKETLAQLGYFPYRVSNNYYRTLQTAIGVFAGQMRIGTSDGSEITPLMQAMLADGNALPKAVCPVLDIFDYGWEPTNNSYTPYTYARVTRTSVQQGTQVGFAGKITASHTDGTAWYYAVQMENDAEKVVYVQYTPLPRTTVFQVGDSVAVFGVTQGIQALSYDGMGTSRLLVLADRVGYGE